MTASARECPSCHTPLPAEAHFCFRCGHATPTEPGVPPRTMPTGEMEVARVRDVLADRYRIERVVGEGGMATVYVAEDLKHHRRVAVKVMRPELSATLGGDRFLREIEIAAQLSHPHILPMYDGGRTGAEGGRTGADELLYYVMPYVEGESLAGRIAREGELPVAEALGIAREVAEALAYAHKRGIVHRDIKPANILLSEGHALVADFGIARAVDHEGTAITATGLAIGTPQYMSPEQATGGREVDGRTDIYALGAVLYEMLSGEPPFTGRTPQAVVARMMTERPRALSATREGLPAQVETVVTRALARSPADRYATAAEFAAAIDQARQSFAYSASTVHRVGDTGERTGGQPAGGQSAALWPTLGAAAMVALTLVAFLVGRWGLPGWALGFALALLAAGVVMIVLTVRAERARRSGTAVTGWHRMLTWRNAALGGVGAVLAWALVASAAAAGRTAAGATDATADAAAAGTHLAVLPFQNQGDSADNYIVDGITDEVRGKLSSVEGLAVTASGSAALYRGSRLPPAQIARELGVSHLLVGRVRWAGTGDSRRVQVVSELVDGTSGATTWQQTFEAPLTDVFAVQSQIASRVAGALGAQMGAAESRTLARRPTINPAAWDAYLKGRAVTGIDPVALRRAVGHFETAVALDSSFVEAWAGLSLASTRLFSNGGRERTVIRRAREAWERAQAIDSSSAVGYTAEATYHSLLNQPTEARVALNRALQLAPNDPDVLGTAGRAYSNVGDHDVGVRYLERARELDPRSAQVLGDLQRAYLASGRLDEAIGVSDAAIANAPTDLGTYEWLAMAHVGRGDVAAATAAAQRAIASGMSAPALAAYFAGYFELGWVLEPEVQALIPRLTPNAFDDDRAWWGQALATHHWMNGRRDLARAYADSALAQSLEQSQAVPDDPAPLALYGLMLAYLGRKAEAIDNGRRALAMSDPNPSAFGRAYDRTQLIRIYLATGEPELAMDEIARLLEQRTYVTRAWMRVDPLYASLRGNPRFERLTSE